MMERLYNELIDQTYYFPQEGFTVENEELLFNDVSMKALIDQYGTPLKVSYLPKIGAQIDKIRGLFGAAIERHNYEGSYQYAYCTKSSHLSFVLDQVTQSKAHLELSSAFDVDIVERLLAEGKITHETFILCNGYKTEAYAKGIERLISSGFQNVIPILDNVDEIHWYDAMDFAHMRIGLRLATEEQPDFELYTSRFGIRPQSILDFYMEYLQHRPKYEVCMLHFFVYTGIRDTTYYWNELVKAMHTYANLKSLNPDLQYFNIGGGMPIRYSLGDEYDYAYMTDAIVEKIKEICEKGNIAVPNLFSEFGSFTIAESGALLLKVLGTKRQNDREVWYIINNSIMNALPDTWAINRKFILLPVNKWNNPYQQVILGGLTCDNDDYYDSDGQLLLPIVEDDTEEPLYLGFFHTGAYQDMLAGFGGVKHCLIPSVRHILLDRAPDGSLVVEEFAQEQRPEHVLRLLGYR